MAIAIGYGTVFSWGAAPVVVGELTRIGPVNITIAKQDSTNLGANWKTILPGLLDPGDVELEGWFRPGNAGQAAMLASLRARTSDTFLIEFPTSISTSTWTGTAYVTSFVAGDATPEGIVPWTATISITGEPTLGVVASGGLTALTGVDSAAGGLVFLPVFLATTILYSVAVGNAITWVKFTATAAAHTITYWNEFDGAEQTIASGALSGEIALGIADTTNLITITAKEALKSAQVTTIYVNKAA